MSKNNNIFINNLLNSKQLYDYSKNLLNFTQKRRLQTSNEKKTRLYSGSLSKLTSN